MKLSAQLGGQTGASQKSGGDMAHPGSPLESPLGPYRESKPWRVLNQLYHLVGNVC